MAEILTQVCTAAVPAVLGYIVWLLKRQKRDRDSNSRGTMLLFVIDHDYTKSWEEWKKKIMERGGADPNYHKALREFFFYNPDMSHLDTGENAVQSYE